MAYNKLDGDSDAAEAHSKAAGKKKSMAKKIVRLGDSGRHSLAKPKPGVERYSNKAST